MDGDERNVVVLWPHCVYIVSILVINDERYTLCLVQSDFFTKKCTGVLGCDSLLKISGVAWGLVAFEIF